MPELTILENTVAPTTPASNYGKLYLKDDAIWFLNDEGFSYPVVTGNNLIINGGFDIQQRGTVVITIGAAIAADKYTFDRWRVNGQTNTQTITMSQQDGRGVTGITSRNFARHTVGIVTGKVSIGQIIEGQDTIPLRNALADSVSFQVKLKASANSTWKIGIFKHTGTIDTVATSFVVNTAGWNADASDPTWGANLAEVAQTTCAVTTTFQQFTVFASVPVDTNNLIAIIWSDAGMAAATYLDIAEAGLYVGIATRLWLPRSTQQELAMCQRYAISYGTEAAYENIGIGLSSNTTTTVSIASLPVVMRAIPTIESYGNFAKYSTTTGNGTNVALSAAPTLSNASTKVAKFTLTVTGGLTGSQPSLFQKYNDAVERLVLTAEL